MPKGINETCIYEALEASPFLRSETVCFNVFLGAGEVKGRVWPH